MRVTILTIGAAMALGGCQYGHEKQAEPLDGSVLVEVTTYGWSSPSDAPRELSPVEGKHAGGELGNVMDIAEDDRGFIYVLDAAFQKIVVFQPDGQFERLILGGAGSGPGEFSRPRSITLDAANNVWVYDQVAARLTRFSNRGDVHRTVPLSTRIATIEAHGNSVFGVRTTDSSQAALVVLDSTGHVVNQLIRPSANDLRVGGGQALFAMGLDSHRGRVLVAHGAIGIWSVLDGDSVYTVGSPIFPNDSPVEAPVSEHSPRLQTHLAHYVWGIGATRDGRIGVFYANGLLNPNTRDGFVYHLGLFTSDGKHLGSLPVQADRGTFLMSSTNDDIFVVRESPYPHVVRLRITTMRG